MLARLQAVSSRNMYSEHGLLALIRPEFGQVCQWLIVVSYCRPGSPQHQADLAIVVNISRAGYLGPALRGSVTQCVVQGLSASTALHELVAQADREISILEEHRVVGLQRIVALLDQHANLLLLAILALDELHHVGMPVLYRLHLGGAAGLAAALDHRGDLVVDPHERQRARRPPAAGELFAVRAERRKIRARARAELEEHRLAAGELHDVFHVVARRSG